MLRAAAVLPPPGVGGSRAEGTLFRAGGAAGGDGIFCRSPPRCRPADHGAEGPDGGAAAAAASGGQYRDSVGRPGPPVLAAAGRSLLLQFQAPGPDAVTSAPPRSICSEAARFFAFRPVGPVCCPLTKAGLFCRYPTVCCLVCCLRRVTFLTEEKSPKVRLEPRF